MATYLGRPTYAPVSLAIAVSVMVGADPRLIWDTGFQLTALGTGAIVAFSPIFDRLTSRLPSALAASVATTTAAQIGVLPVQILSFHVLSPVSLLANAVVLPFIPLTMAVGFFTAIVPQLPITAIAYGLVHMVILVARWMVRADPGRSHQSHNYSRTGRSCLLLCLIAVAALVWRLSPTVRRPRKGEWAFGLSAAVVGMSFAFTSPRPGNEIRFLTNKSALLTSHGQNVLIDGGSRPSKLLARLGEALPFPTEHLNAIVDTDPRSKNTASLLDVVQHVKVDRVFDPGIEYSSQTYARWRGWLLNHHIPLAILRPGLLLHGRTFSIRALAPDGIYSNAKDGAGILTIGDGGLRILYLGPASQKEQQGLPFQTHVRAQIIISSVPVDPTLRAATGARIEMRPRAGHFIRPPG